MNVEITINQSKIFHTIGTFQKIPLTLDCEKNVTIKFVVPLIDIQGYWTSELSMPSTFLSWGISLMSAAQKHIPFISFFNRRSENKFSFGSTNLIDNAQISVLMNQQSCTYDITFSQRFSAITEDKIYYFVLDSQNYSWQSALDNFRGAGDWVVPNFPPKAFDPVYCTWYAVHAQLTQTWVEKIAKKAKELGFKTFILDDGWCFDEQRRVNPETLPMWYQAIGDWELSEKKFPNWESHRQKMRELGLNYLFWVTPFLVGVNSRFYQTYGEDCTNSIVKEGCVKLNIDCNKACGAMLEKLPQVMKKYDLDGLKIDFIDSIPPESDNGNGSKIYEFCKKLIQEVRTIKSDALIEFRESYNTPLTVNLATQFRVCDVPFDYMENFRRLARIRLQLGDSIPIHADPIYFHKDECDENVAKHFIAALVGVPMLSIDLTELKSEHTKIIETYLDFYYRYQKTLNFGKWSFKYHDESLSYALVKDGEKEIVILGDSARVNEFDLSKTIICNLSPNPIKLSADYGYNYFGEKTFNMLLPGGFSEKY